MTSSSTENHHVRVSVAAEVRAFEASFRPASLAAAFAQAVSALARAFAAVVESAAGAAARAFVFAPGPRAAVAVVALAVVSAVVVLASCAIGSALVGVSAPTEDSLAAAHSVALQWAARWDGAVQQEDDPIAAVLGDCSAPQAVLADAQAADLLADAQLADSAAPRLASAAYLVPAWHCYSESRAAHPDDSEAPLGSELVCSAQVSRCSAGPGGLRAVEQARFLRMAPSMAGLEHGSPEHWPQTWEVARFSLAPRLLQPVQSSESELATVACRRYS